MHRLNSEESHAMELMQKDNSRGISKDNDMELVSIREKVDPEVAKALIAQMSESVKGIVELEGLYKSLASESLSSVGGSLNACHEAEDLIIQTSATEAGKDIPFEQKQYFFEQMSEAAIRKEKKDTEHRSTVLKILEYGSIIVTAGFTVIGCIFIGSGKVKPPTRWFSK